MQMHEHESYTGDRTKEALVSFADALVPSAGQPHRKHADLASAPKASGCNMAGGFLTGLWSMCLVDLTVLLARVTWGYQMKKLHTTVW